MQLWADECGRIWSSWVRFSTEQFPLHTSVRFNDKRITAGHDSGHKFKLKYESVGIAETPPACAAVLGCERWLACEQHLEDASAQLCRCVALPRPVMFGHLCENPAAGHFQTAPTHTHLARHYCTQINISFIFHNDNFVVYVPNKPTPTSAAIYFGLQCAFLQKTSKKIKFELTFSEFQSL